MKKIVNFIILFIICLFPIVGNAKTTLTYEWKVNNSDFLTSVEGKYYFTGEEYFYFDVYGKDGNLEENLVIELPENMKVSDFYADELLFSSMKYDGLYLKYSSTLDRHYSVEHSDGTVYIYGEMTNDTPDILSFDDENDIETLRNVLGKEYDVVSSIYADGLDIDGFTYEDDYYVAWCYNDDYDFYKIYNLNGDLVYEIRFEYEDRIRVHVHDNKIFQMEEDTKIDIYDFDGELIETLNVSEDLNRLYPDNELILNDFYFTGNNLLIKYEYAEDYPALDDNPTGMTTVRGNSDINDNLKVSYNPESVTLKYRMSNDMTLVTSKTGGSFTAEKKIDEFDREYVELDIKLADGYIVDSIKVTDINGNEIEVTDNKFYMPGSDVTIQVLYKGGEYLPIPDTGLGRNITIILIGLILVGLGVYTINFVRQEQK